MTPNEQQAAKNAALYLKQPVVISSIKNDVHTDEEIATVKCTLGDHAFYAFWTSENGFEIPAGIDSCEPIKHTNVVAYIKQQLTQQTRFQGYNDPNGYAGLVLNA